MKSSATANKSIRKASTLPKNSVTKSAGTKDKAGGKTTNWINILEVSRARLSFDPRNIESPEVFISNMTPSFCRTFALLGDKVLMSAVLGKATTRDFPFQVEKSMLSGHTTMHYINLYRSDGAVLSCHAVIRPLPYNPTNTMNNNHEHQAILTIRSASAVANANYIGIGLLGIDRIPNTVLESVIGGQTTTTITSTTTGTVNIENTKLPDNSNAIAIIEDPIFHVHLNDFEDIDTEDGLN